MASIHRSTDPPDDLLLQRFVAADEARFRGATDWASSSLQDLPRAEISKLSHMLECLELLSVVGRPQFEEHPCEPTVLSPAKQQTQIKTPGDFQQPVIPAEYAGYQMETQLGRGGFGIVYRARDEKLGRKVAIKIPLPHIIASDSARRRFELEARASAVLQHPNIVVVHETRMDSQPAIVYEYCDGGTLASFCSAQSGPLPESLILDVMVCIAQALRHAHARGVLHRDLKPANILLKRAEVEERVNGFESGGDWWIPKLCDFGLARIVDETSDMTQTDVIIGTVDYMAPEQASGHSKETGTHTDVFSLGAMLYWMMTGEPPFKASSRAHALMKIELLDPIPPTKTRPHLSRDLESICLKCLQKSPQDRYESAAAILNDLKALQRGDPISVGAPSILSLLRRFRRHHPLRFMGLVFTILVGTTVLLLELLHGWQQQQLLKDLDAANTKLVVAINESQMAEHRATQQRIEYQSLLYASDMKLADQALKEGDLSTCDAILRRHIPADQEIDLRDIEWASLWREAHATPTLLSEFQGAGYDVRFSPDGHLMAACGADATVRIFDTTSWQQKCLLQTGQVEVNSVAFSPVTGFLASAGDDGTVRLWDWQNQQQVLSVDTACEKAFGVRFSADGRRFFTCGNSPQIEWWSVADGVRGGTLDGHHDTVETISMSQDGRYLYSAGADFLRCVFDLTRNELLDAKAPVHTQRISAIDGFQWHDRCLFLSGMVAGRTAARSALIIEDAESDRQWRLPSPADDVQSVAVSNDGQTAACGLKSGAIVLYNIRHLLDEDGVQDVRHVSKRWMAHEGRVYGLTFHPDGKQLFSTGTDGKLYCWQLRQHVSESELLLPSEHANFQTHAGGVAPGPTTHDAIAVLEDGLLVRLAADNSTAVEVLNQGLSGSEQCWFSPDGRYGATSNLETGLQYWRLHPRDDSSSPDQSQLPLAEVRWRIPAESSGQLVTSVAWLSDQAVLLTRQRAAVAAELRDPRSGALMREFRAVGDGISDSLCCDCSADGRRLAFGCGNDIVCFDVQSEQSFLLEGASNTITALKFATNPERGKANLLVSGSSDRTLRIWDLESRETRYILRGHSSAVHAIAISALGRTIISLSETKEINFWQLSSGALLRRNWLSASGRSEPWAIFPGGAIQMGNRALRVHSVQPSSVFSSEN